MNALAHICPLLPKQPEQTEHFVNESIYEVLSSVALQFKDIVKEWSGRVLNTQNKLTEVFTEEGICFTYNALNARDMYTDE